MFLGSKGLGLAILAELQRSLPSRQFCVVTPDDSDDRRSDLTTYREHCDTNGFPFFIAKRKGDLQQALEETSPEVVFVASWYWLIDEAVLRLPPKGFIGFHASLLPKLRGNAPLVWALLQSESETGVSLFHLDGGMDTGDIVDQSVFPIGQRDTIGTLLEKTEQACRSLARQYAAPILHGTAPRHRQDSTYVSYGSKRLPEDGLIDWAWPASHIERFVRAQTRPYPGAFTHLPDGRRLTIWQASVFPHAFHGIPGLVCQTHGEGVTVACGEGALVVDECETSNSRGTAATEHLAWGVRLR